MKPLVYRPAASADIREAYLWYQSQRPGLGEQFLEAVAEAASAIAARPATYAVVYRDTRRAVLKRFPYGLFFRVVEGQVVVVACYHARRNPEGWKRRR